MQNLLHKASNNRKLYVFLFCLFLATFFWLLNALSNQFTTDIVFKANYINSPKNKVVLNELPNSFNIKARALGFDLLAYKMSFAKPVIDIDLSKLKEINISKSLTNYNLSSRAFLPMINSQLGDKIDIKSIYPAKVYFAFDERKEKVVKIKPVTTLKFKSQYKQFGKIEVKPAITKVSGPASVIDTMETVYTEHLQLNNLFETVTASVSFNKTYHVQHVNFTPEKALLHIPVEKFTESLVKVDLEYLNVPDTIELKAIPAEVELKFLLPLSKMASLQSATFKANVDYNQINDNFNQKLKIELVEYPDFIQIISLEPSKVEYILKRK